jgi:hypothetical protein
MDSGVTVLKNVRFDQSRVVILNIAQKFEMLLHVFRKPMLNTF